MNAKGSISSEIIIWIAVILGVLLLIGWFFSNFRFQRSDFEIIDNDLSRITFMANDACRTYSYSESYSPLTLKGTLVASNDEICIFSSQIEHCKNIVCELSYNEIDLEKINVLKVEKHVGNKKIFIK